MPNAEALELLGSVVHTANVLLEWLMTYAIHSTILIGGLLVLTSTAAGRKLVSGHGSWVWRFALVGAVVTSSLQSMRSAAPLAGTLRLDGDTPARTMVRVEARHIDTFAGSEPRTTRTARNAEQRQLPTSARPEPRTALVKAAIQISPIWPLIVLGAWFIIAATLVCWFAIARARFLSSIGPRRNATYSLAGNALRHLRYEGQIDRAIALTVSDRLTSPVALSGDEICLPSRALAELDPIRMESILAHELAHLVRRDPAWLTI